VNGRGPRIGDCGQEFTDGEEHGIPSLRTSVQHRGRCFFPILGAHAAVANEQVTERTARRDVVSVVLIMHALEADQAGGRVNQLKGGVVMGLRHGSGHSKQALAI